MDNFRCSMRINLGIAFLLLRRLKFLENSELFSNLLDTAIQTLNRFIPHCAMFSHVEFQNLEIIQEIIDDMMDGLQNQLQRNNFLLLQLQLLLFSETFQLCVLLILHRCNIFDTQEGYHWSCNFATSSLHRIKAMNEKTSRLFELATKVLLSLLVVVIFMTILAGTSYTVYDFRLICAEPFHMAFRTILIDILTVLAILEILRTALAYYTFGRVKVTCL